MKLYQHPFSPNCRKVVATARLLGIELEMQQVELMQGEGRTPAYLALNPNAKVPTLADGDFVLWESNAICQYLASLAKTDLWPEDVRARADVSRWQCWQLTTWGPPIGQLLQERLFKPMRQQEPDADKVADGLQRWGVAAKVLEAQLADRRFVTGDTLTLADIAIGSGLTYAAQIRLPLADYPHIARWNQALDEIPAWRESAYRFG